MLFNSIAHISKSLIFKVDFILGDEKVIVLSYVQKPEILLRLI